MEATASMSVFMIPGMTMELETEVDAAEGSRGLGVFVYPENTIRFANKTLTLTNGWAQLNESVGKIDPIANTTKVRYTHKRPEKNTIYFFSATGEVGIISIVAVPIHDHSSIVQGGPAYGSYFSDDEAIN